MSRSKVIMSKKPKSADKRLGLVRKSMYTGLKNYLKKHIQLRERLTATWDDKNKLSFNPQVKYEGTKTKVTLGITANSNARGASISVYRMLNGPLDDPNAEETAVRRAALAGDGPKGSYQPRTSKGKFKTNKKGNNRAVKVSKAYNFPGIKYRRWDEAALEQLQPELMKAVEEGVKRGFKK